MSEVVYICQSLKEIAKRERTIDEKIGIVVTTPKYCVASPTDFSALNIGLFSLMFGDSIFSAIKNIKNPKISEESTREIDELVGSFYEEKRNEDGIVEVMNLHYKAFLTVISRESIIETRDKLRYVIAPNTSELEQNAAISIVYTKRILNDIDVFLLNRKRFREMRERSRRSFIV